MYDESIEESKRWRKSRDARKGRTYDQFQPMFKKINPNKDGSSAPMSNSDRAGGSKVVKPNCATCGKKNFGKCIADTDG